MIISRDVRVHDFLQFDDDVGPLSGKRSSR